MHTLELHEWTFGSPAVREVRTSVLSMEGWTEAVGGREHQSTVDPYGGRNLSPGSSEQ